MSSLSVCLIAKNEENNIGRCLESIKDIADEIVLVDTGSTDATIDIAKKYNAKVFTTVWENDFSTPRNMSIENATSDWILFLDCDEALTEGESKKIKDLIDAKSTYEAFHLKIRTLLSGQESGVAIVLRLFRNKKEYRFVGKMHEQIINSIISVKGHDSIGMAEITIDHYGYDPEIVNQEEKTHRNLEILLNYEEEDKDGYYYYALGNEYCRLGDYDKALETYDVCLQKTYYKKNRNIYYSYLCINIIKLNYSLKKYHKVLTDIEKFKKDLPNFRDLYFMEGITYMDIGMFSKAKDCLLKYKNCTEQNFEYPSNDFDKAYNIDDILKQLSQNTVGNCVSTAIYLDKTPQNIQETIKSVNEISSSVVVVIDSDKKDYYGQYIEPIKNYGANILFLKNENRQKDLHFVTKNIKGNYLLILNEDEIVPYTSLNSFSNLSDYSRASGFNVQIKSQFDDSINKELKLIKINKKMKNTRDALETIKESTTIIDTNIVIVKGSNF